MVFEISLCKLFLKSCSWEHEQPETMLGNMFVGTWQPIAWNLPREFVLGTRTCSWEPVLRTLACEPVLAKLACKPVLGEPCLGTCSCKPCLGTCSQEPCRYPARKPVLGTLAWELEALFLEPLLVNLFLRTLLGNLFLRTLLGNLVLRTLLGNLETCSQEHCLETPCLRTYSWKPFLQPFLGNLFLGTLLGNLFLAWEFCLATVSGTLAWQLFLEPLLGNLAWEPVLGNLAWESFPVTLLANLNPENVIDCD